MLFSKPPKSDWQGGVVYITKKHLERCYLKNGAAGENGNSHCSNGPLSCHKIQTSFHSFLPTIRSDSRFPRESNLQGIHI